MIRSRRTEDALAQMRAANPSSAEELMQSIDEGELGRAMQRAIARGEVPPQPNLGAERTVRARGAVGEPGRVGVFSRRHLAFAGLVCVGLIALLVALGGGSVDSLEDAGHPTYAAAAVRVAEANPRLLVTAPGWSIVHAHSFEVASGSLDYRYRHTAAYGPDARSLQLSWYPARLYRSFLRERQPEGSAATSTVLGRRAITFHQRQRGSDYFTTVLPPRGRAFVELRASLGASEYSTVLRSLRAVGVDRWLAAMPPEVVRPKSRSEVVAQMLQGVPLPPGFQVSALAANSDVTVRFELGRAVAGAVACGWLQSWQRATRSRDETAVRGAVEAMAGARRWPVLLQMVHERGYRGEILPANGAGWPSNIVEAGREIAAGHLRRHPAVRTIRRHGSVIGVMTPRNAAPVSVLGCDLAG